MACYHPLRLWIIGTRDNGKALTVVTSYEQTYLQVGIQEFFEDESIPIPCGQCIGCRLEYSRQWAMRCMLESTYHEKNYFLTLTYDDEHITPSFDFETGEIKDPDVYTLAKHDLQAFNKRLREYLRRRGKPSYRFFACGEYGSQTARPHYHMIAFGLELDDLEPLKVTKTGFQLWKSPTLDREWGNGHVFVGSVSFESCAYVARYVMKKHKGKESQVYLDYGIEPEFTLMSRRPGIGKLYFEDNFESIYENDDIIIRGKSMKPPRYYDKLMEELDFELMDEVKAKRNELAEHLESIKEDISDADYLMRLEFAERNKKSQIKHLVRPLE